MRFRIALIQSEGLYAFRFDLNGDAREEVTFKFRFGEPRHGDGSAHTHIQPFVVRKATGSDALRGDSGESRAEGETGSVATNSGLRAYVGIAPDLFAANAGFVTFMTAFYKEQRYNGDAFLHQQNPFARRNVTAIVLEVPSELIGKGKINAWATISLFGHVPEVQVSRWGLPMVTHLFLNDSFVGFRHFQRWKSCFRSLFPQTWVAPGGVSLALFCSISVIVTMFSHVPTGNLCWNSSRVFSVSSR